MILTLLQKLKNTAPLVFFFILIVFSNCKNKFEDKYSLTEPVFNLESDADSVYFYSSITGPQKLFPEKGTNVYQMDMDIDSLNHAIFSYYFTEYRNGIAVQSNYQQYIGSELMDKAPVAVDQRTGTIDYIELNSSFLNETRKITIYTPPNYTPEKTYPVIFFVDGEDMPYYARFVENLIVENKIEEILLVGIVNKEEDSIIDYRSYDQLENFYNTRNESTKSALTSHKENLVNRHENYIRFIKDELMDFLRLKYSISDEYFDKAVYGVSNGGSFVAKLNGVHPELFGHYLAFSIGWNSNLKTPDWNLEPQPKSYLSAGKFEGGFYQNTLKWYNLLSENNKEVNLNVNLSGHDRLMWEMDFQGYLLQIFGK